MKLAATTAGICVLALATFAGAQDPRSLTNFGWQDATGNPVGSVSFPVPAGDIEDDAPAEERVILLQNTVKQLTQSLANANAEAETYKKQAADLTLKLQALGIAGLEGDEGKLEQRLLAAVRDLRLAKQGNEDLRAGLIQLSESVSVLLKAAESVPAETRMDVEATLRRTAELLGSPTGVSAAEATEATLSDAMVVEMRDDLSLVVTNVGTRHGVKIGMPFQVWRGETKIADVRVIDARERISGAVIQNLVNPKNPVKAGDRLRVDARQ